MVTKAARTAPYGSWKSPVTSGLIVSQSVSLSEVRLDGANVYWLEGRPQEQGRCGVVRAACRGRRQPTSRRYALSTRASSPIAPMAAEFGQPQWAFGMSTYCFAGPDRIVCTCSQAGLGKLTSIDLATGTVQPLETPFTQYASVQADGDRVVFIGGSPSLATCVVALDLSSGRHRILKKATDILDQSGPGLADYLTSVETVEFPTEGGETAFGLFYPPYNPDYAGCCLRRYLRNVKSLNRPTRLARTERSRQRGSGRLSGDR
jgi:dipeptidyl aminopeptidase/acylaminoacyl peptidase